MSYVQALLSSSKRSAFAAPPASMSGNTGIKAPKSNPTTTTTTIELQWSQDDLRAASRKHQAVVSVQVQVLPISTAKVNKPVVPPRSPARKEPAKRLLINKLVGRPIDYTPSPLGEFSVESLCNRAESALTNAEAIQLMKRAISDMEKTEAKHQKMMLRVEGRKRKMARAIRLEEAAILEMEEDRVVDVVEDDDDDDLEPEIFHCKPVIFVKWQTSWSGTPYVAKGTPARESAVVCEATRQRESTNRENKASQKSPNRVNEWAVPLPKTSPAANTFIGRVSHRNMIRRTPFLRGRAINSVFTLARLSRSRYRELLITTITQTMIFNPSWIALLSYPRPSREDCEGCSDISLEMVTGRDSPVMDLPAMVPSNLMQQDKPSQLVEIVNLQSVVVT